MRRRASVNVRRGPGLLGTVARTAVVAGTATAVSKGVSGSMDASAQQAAQQQAAQQQAAQQQIDAAAQRAVAEQQALAQQAATPAAAAGADRLTQLRQLGELKQQGILTDAEFEAEKARILA